MCGIAGILSFHGKLIHRNQIKCMTDLLAHRGPDAEGCYVSGAIGLGHRRLAILDLSPDGIQPMSNEDQSIWIVFNGEIYNFQEIRVELQQKGHVFHSRTDTEVIVHAYEEWGLECLKRLNGMFAFGLWDETKQRLWLVRDRLGIKPLFFAHLADTLLFGSEIKALLSYPQLARTIDYEALAYYLALNYTPAPYTLFANVRQLLPGQYLLADAFGKVQQVTYWDVTYDETNPLRHEAAYIEQFNALLEDSIRLRLNSDVPFGAFLSGGVDSSSVVYWMSQLLSDPVNTFTIGFNEDSFDELPYAQQVSRLLDTMHHERIVLADAATILPRVVWHAEEPTADSSMIAVYHLAKLAREHVTMVLTGDGADEILAGYETYQAHHVHQMYRRIPHWFRSRIIMPLVHALPVSDRKVSWDFKLRQFVKNGEQSSEDAHASWRMIFNAPERAALLQPLQGHPESRVDVLNLYRAAFAATNAQDPLNRMLYVDTRFYLPNDMLVKVDRMTMAHGLEAREPMLDYRLVEFAASVPPGLKLKYLFKKKYLLKKAMQGKLPDQILWRKKAGFNVPNGRWIKGDLKAFVTDHLSPIRVRETGLFDPQSVDNLLHDHFSERADNSHQLWGLLSLMLWFQQFIKDSVVNAG